MRLASVLPELDHVWIRRAQIQYLHQLSDQSCHASVGAQDDYAALGCPKVQPGWGPDPRTRAGAVAQKDHLRRCPALLLVALVGGDHMQLPSVEAPALAGCQRLDGLQRLHSSHTAVCHWSMEESREQITRR